MTDTLHLTMGSGWARFSGEDQRRELAPLDTLRRALREAAPTWGLDPTAITLTEALARLDGTPDPEDTAALSVLALIALMDVQRGSTRSLATPQAMTARVTQIERRLSQDAAVALSALRPRIIALCTEGASNIIGRSPDARRPLLLVDGWLSMQRMAQAERRLGAHLRPRLQQVVKDPEAQAAIDDVQARPAIFGGQPAPLSDEQAHALSVAAGAPMAIISGGPGTGKTSIVVALLRTLVRLGLDPTAVCLTAPTGKAAYRMGEAVRHGLGAVADPAEADTRLADNLPTPTTLHRVLGYSPARDAFKHHGNNPLNAQLVVVDESSMVDLALMEHLLAALAPHTRLVLLGDADQLPSVAAGAVFRDLVRAKLDAACVLTHSFRMRADDPDGLAVLTVARRINKGAPLFGQVDGVPLIETRETTDALTWRGVELLPIEGQQLDVLLHHWHARFVAGDDEVQRLRDHHWDTHEGHLSAHEIPQLDVLFAQQTAARLLCLTRAFRTGAERTNTRLHRLTALKARVSAEIPFLVGEPVMMLHNDYDRNLFNGDQGLVLWGQSATEHARRLVVFPGVDGYRAFPLSALASRIELCYAMTVHKAQGSEFQRVGVLLPSTDLPLLSRALLYTAVTRARQGVAIFGSPHLLERAAERQIDRSSGLGVELAR